MKSERRHELEHNDLDTELSKIVIFTKKHANRLLTGLIVVLAVIVLWIWLDRTNQKNIMILQDNYNALKIQATIPFGNEAKLIEGFRNLSEQDTVEWIAADSLLELGLLNASLANRAETKEKRDQACAKAISYYKMVIAKYSNGESQAVAAAAYVAQGKIDEDKGDFDAARKSYKKVVDMKSLEGYPVMEQAKLAIKTLDSYTGKIRLAKKAPAWAEPVMPPKPAPKDEAPTPAMKALEAVKAPEAPKTK